MKISCKISSQLNRFLCNLLDWPLKAFGRPTVSKSFSIEDVQTSGQHHSDARSSFSNFYTELDFSRHYLGSLCKTSERRGNLSGRYPVLQNIPSFIYKRGNEDRPEARPIRPGVDLLWEELHYSGNAVAEDCPDEAIFRPDAPQPEFEFEQN
jgi:hypothetical protein